MRPGLRLALNSSLAAALALPCAALVAAEAEAARAQPQSPGAGPSYGLRADVRAFIDDVADRRGFDRAWLALNLAQARKVESVQKLIMPPAGGPTAKNWGAYRDRFVEPRRIAAGVAFWNANAQWFERAEAQWGVPASVIAGIIGVETYYGRIMGNYRVLDALATLAFDFPTGRSDRSPYFKGELEEFLALCQRNGADPQRPLGSFAGAIGLGQFMPGSINQYAVDLDADGRIDLEGSAADAIGSVANYLAQHGWKPGLPATYPVVPPEDAANRARLLEPDIVPRFTAAQFAELGAQLPEPARAHEGLLALVLLENGGAAPSYVAGTQNFYTVTRYNWSSYYALAVLTLGEAVAAERQKTLPAPESRPAPPAPTLEPAPPAQ